DLARVGEGALGIDGDERVQRWVERVDRVEGSLDLLPRPDLASGDLGHHLLDGRPPEPCVGHGGTVVLVPPPARPDRIGAPVRRTLGLMTELHLDVGTARLAVTDLAPEGDAVGTIVALHAGVADRRS